MSNFKTFMVSAHDDNLQVVLEVDMDKLTPELATEINSFWGGEDHRLTEEGGDVVKAVIRLYGSSFMSLMLESWGGASFSHKQTDLASAWTRDMQHEEGWPPGDDTPHGVLGIRVVSAECELPGFDGCELHEGRPA